jgi:phosphatidylglycerophosphatase A
VYVHQAGDAILGQKDSSTLVWDELAGFVLAVLLVPFTWQLAVVAFVLERILDIAKVPPANWVERRVSGGWGVVGDDLVAGAYTCGSLHVLVAFAPSAVGLPG